jgi:hypothetical protein
MEARSATSIVIDAGCPGSIISDNIVTKGPPKRLSGSEIIDMLDKLTPDPERLGYFEGYGETCNLTHKCALWELSYMLALILMHNIDVMCQECNMDESIISACMGFSSKKRQHEGSKGFGRAL